MEDKTNQAAVLTLGVPAESIERLTVILQEVFLEVVTQDKSKEDQTILHGLWRSSIKTRNKFTSECYARGELPVHAALEPIVLSLDVPESHIERLGQLLLSAVAAAPEPTDSAILVKLWLEHTRAVSKLYEERRSRGEATWSARPKSV